MFINDVTKISPPPSTPLRETSSVAAVADKTNISCVCACGIMRW